MKRPRLIVGLTACVAGLLVLLTQKLSCGPGWGGGAGVPDAGQGGGGASLASVRPVESSPPPKAASKPLQITIDDTKYLVGDVSVESVDEVVKMAAAVPKDVSPPRVLVLLRPTARYMAEKKLIDALRAANVDFIVEK